MSAVQGTLSVLLPPRLMSEAAKSPSRRTWPGLCHLPLTWSLTSCHLCASVSLRVTHRHQDWLRGTTRDTVGATAPSGHTQSPQAKVVFLVHPFHRNCGFSPSSQMAVAVPFGEQGTRATCAVVGFPVETEVGEIKCKNVFLFSCLSRIGRSSAWKPAFPITDAVTCLLPHGTEPSVVRP